MVAGFNEAVQNAAQIDLFTGILPFSITFIVFYLAAERIPIVKERENNVIPGLLALIFSGFIANFLVNNPAYQTFYSQFVGSLSIGLVGLLGLFTVLAFAGYDASLFEKDKSPVAFTVLALLIGLLAFAGSGGLGALLPGVELPGVGLELGSVTEFIEQGGWALLFPLVLIAFFLLDSGPSDTSGADVEVSTD
jgi:hypothetical protein